MSMFISEVLEWIGNKTSPVQIGGGVKITGSLYLSESFTTGSAGYYVSNSTGLQMNVVSTGSIAMANPQSSTLNQLFPNAVTGSIYLVGRSTETWLAFKGLDGGWKTVTASAAA